MTQIGQLLELRTKIKNKKPDFVRQDYEKRKRIKYVWRKPKGIHSKIRHHIRGKRKMPSPGYKSPVKVRHLVSGLNPVIVSNISQIPQSKEFGIIVSSSVGIKKRVEILKKSNEFGISVLNIDSNDYIKKYEEALAKKKELKAQKTSKEAKEKPKAKGQKQQEKSQKTEEQKQKEQKREKDKLLIKKV